MLNANAHKKFTACGDTAAETLLKKVLSEMKERFSGTGLCVVLGAAHDRVPPRLLRVPHYLGLHRLPPVPRADHGTLHQLPHLLDRHGRCPLPVLRVLL